MRWHPGARGEGVCGLAGPLLFWSWTWKDQGGAALQALSHCSGGYPRPPWASCPSDTCGDPERSLCPPRALKGTGLRPSILPSVRSPGPTSAPSLRLFCFCHVWSAAVLGVRFQRSTPLPAPYSGQALACLSPCPPITSRNLFTVQHPGITRSTNPTCIFGKLNLTLS